MAMSEQLVTEGGKSLFLAFFFLLTFVVAYSAITKLNRGRCFDEGELNKLHLRF